MQELYEKFKRVGKIGRVLAVEIKHFSEAICVQIASYYRLAVQRNKGDINAIIKAVEAIPYYLGVNDNNAEEYHRFCPFEEHRLCQYQSAKYNKRPSPKIQIIYLGRLKTSYWDSMMNSS